VIRDVTETLEAFLNQPGLPPELANAQISFDRPSDPFNPAQPTINLFLFDIQENVELRSNDPIVRRQGNVTFVQRPPARITCTYLLTAWPVNGPDLAKQEHRMLSQALALFMSAPTIPPAFLVGSLVGQEPPLPMMITQAEGVRNAAEFWAALGNRMKPSLLVSVTFSLTVGDEQTFPAVITHRIEWNADAFHRIGGTVRDAANAPVASAHVRLVELPRSTASNARGEFMIPVIPAGNYTLRVTAGPQTVNKAIAVPAPLNSNYDVQLT
jgi:hypothetical protein